MEPFVGQLHLKIPGTLFSWRAALLDADYRLRPALLDGLFWNSLLLRY